MIITAIPGSPNYTIKHQGLYWSLTGPNGLPECAQGYTVHAITEHTAWSVTACHPTKWQAIGALLRLINKPWSY
jgi:hypothetical protein